MEHEASEQWQPGKVEMDKLIMGFTYLAATSLAVPHFPSYSLIDKPPKPHCPRVEKELRHGQAGNESEVQHTRRWQLFILYLISFEPTQHITRQYWIWAQHCG